MNMNDEEPVIKLYYEDYLEKKIKDLHVDNTRLDEVQTLRKINSTNKDLPMIHLLRANGDLLPEVEGDTITFELHQGEQWETCASGCEGQHLLCYWQCTIDSVAEVCLADRHHGPSR
jgi:hypothetical protein